MEKKIGQFIDFIRNRVWLVTVIVLIITAGASYTASSIELDSNLKRLLPEDAPSVKGLDKLSEAYGGALGRLTIVLEAGEPKSKEDLVEAAEGLAPSIRTLERIRRIEWQRPLDFFDSYRLLYIDYTDLETIQKRIEKRIKWEKERSNPLFVDLKDEEPPSVEFSDITEKYDRMEQSTHYLDQKNSRLLIFVYPDFPANQMEKSRALIDRLNDVVSRQLSEQNSGITHALTGRYKKRIDVQKMLKSDLSQATILAFVIITLFLLFILNSIAGAFLVATPLFVGTIWAIGWAELIFGSLNILTGFLGAVLFGLGVDYGIHLYLRFRELSRQHHLREALSLALQTTGKANLFAGLTTIVALGSLGVSKFRAFYEFGVISIGGMAFILMSYMILFPALVYILRPSNLLDREPRTVGWTSSILRYFEQTGPGYETDQFKRGFKKLVGAFVLLGVLCVVGLTQVDFNRDFLVLETVNTKSWQLDQMVNDVLGHSQTPSVVLTDSKDESQRVVEELRKRKKEADRESGDIIQRVISMEQILPARQDDKRRILKSLKKELEDVPKDTRSDKLNDFLREIREVLGASPLEPDDLPVSLTEPLERKDDSTKSVVLIFPAFYLADTDKRDQYVEMIKQLPIEGAPNRYDAISDAMLLYDILRFVERDTLYMLGLTLIGLMILSWISFRNWKYLFVQTGLIVFAGLSAAGVLGLLGIDFNFLNIIVLPIWLGLGVDASFHILVHLGGDENNLRTHLSTALAISAAFLTSMLGFASLFMSQHEGLFSLGEAAVVGLATILVTNLLAQFLLFGLDQGSDSTRG